MSISCSSTDIKYLSSTVLFPKPETLASGSMMSHVFRKQLWKQSVSKVLKVRPRYALDTFHGDIPDFDLACVHHRKPSYLHDERFRLSWCVQIWCVHVCWTFSLSLVLVNIGLE